MITWTVLFVLWCIITLFDLGGLHSDEKMLIILRDVIILILVAKIFMLI